MSGTRFRHRMLWEASTLSSAFCTATPPAKETADAMRQAGICDRYVAYPCQAPLVSAGQRVAVRRGAMVSPWGKEHQKNEDLEIY